MNDLKSSLPQGDPHAQTLEVSAARNREMVAKAEAASDPWDKLQVSHRDWLIDQAEAMEAGAVCLRTSGQQTEENDQGASLLPADQSASVNTESLPTEAGREIQCLMYLSCDDPDCEAAERCLAAPEPNESLRALAKNPPFGTDPLPTAFDVEQAVYAAYVEARECLAVASLSDEARKRGDTIMTALKLTRRFLFNLEQVGSVSVVEGDSERVSEQERSAQEHPPSGQQEEEIAKEEKWLQEREALLLATWRCVCDHEWGQHAKDNTCTVCDCRHWEAQVNPPALPRPSGQQESK